MCAAPLATLIPAPVGPLVSAVLGTLGTAVGEGHDLPTIAEALLGHVTGHLASA